MFDGWKAIVTVLLYKILWCIHFELYFVQYIFDSCTSKWLVQDIWGNFVSIYLFDNIILHNLVVTYNIIVLCNLYNVSSFLGSEVDVLHQCRSIWFILLSWYFIIMLWLYNIMNLLNLPTPLSHKHKLIHST